MEFNSKLLAAIGQFPVKALDSNQKADAGKHNRSKFRCNRKFGAIFLISAQHPSIDLIARCDSNGLGMPEKRTTALWRSATPLKRAWLELATADQRLAHEELPQADQAMRDLELPQDAGLFDRLLSVAAAAGGAHSKRAASETALKAELLRRISKGEFELVGYRVAPTKGRDPVVIPEANLAKYEPDWRGESLEIRDEVYLDLRVSPANLRRTGVKRGRPGSTEIILSAIDELRGQPNSDFCKISRPQACERVRELLRAKGNETDQLGNGLSDQNIAKLILARCPKRRIKINENK